jgi:hypothetical protein
VVVEGDRHDVVRHPAFRQLLDRTEIAGDGVRA